MHLVRAHRKVPTVLLVGVAVGGVVVGALAAGVPIEIAVSAAVPVGATAVGLRVALRRILSRRTAPADAPHAVTPPSAAADPARRRLIVAGSAGVASAIAAGTVGRLAGVAPAIVAAADPHAGHGDRAGHGVGTVGEVDHARNGFDPTAMLDDWDFGTVSTRPDGRTLREYLIVAQDRTIEVAPGVFFEAWTYNGRVPGPTIRAREGDRIRVEFVNGGSHPHTIHFHGIHSAAMDGVPGQGAGNIAPGGSTVYEFDAFPFGCHLYHCHTSPLKRHIHKGLYGAFIIDPDPARHPEHRAAAERRTVDGARTAGIRELLIVMNAFDTNFDGRNEVYAANTVAFHYANHPIAIGTDEDVRLYLVNLTEFDPLNSLHLHANFFDYYDHGTTLEPTLRTIDTVAQIQAQRGILEFSYRGYEPGQYMFHAHQSEFVELGWMSFFDVVPGRET
jgi:FtsP/CotA-like multicopper oxidase with cupredoxin domain